MNRIATCYQVSALAVLAASAAPLRAELPPGEYAALKREAQEVLHIEVVKVSRVGELNSDGPQVAYRCQARVTQVDRSASGSRAGSMITFDTWYIVPAARKHFAGPVIPPKMYAGWSGRVYLNSPAPDSAGTADDVDVLRLAAYGRSFEPDRKTQRQKSHGDQARKLFEQMEKRLVRAQTIQLNCRGEDNNVNAGAQGKQQRTLRAKFSIGQGNKVLGEVKHSSWQHELTCVSNGTRMQSTRNRNTKTMDTPRHLRDDLVYGLSRLGLLWTSAKSNRRKPLKNRTTVSSFRLGQREWLKGVKVGSETKLDEFFTRGREVHVVHYQIDFLDEGRSLDTTLYIDVKTMLPVLRTFPTYREEYHFRLNEKISDEKFQLAA